MAVVLIARFDGDVHQLTQAYDRGHALIMSRGGRRPSASCATTVRSVTTRSSSLGCGTPRSTRAVAGRARSLRRH